MPVQKLDFRHVLKGSVLIVNSYFLFQHFQRHISNIQKSLHVNKKTVVMGINCDGMKEVISLEIGENESSKYWLGVLNSLKNRGVKDVMIICADGLTCMKEAISAAFPNTEYQRCIVHQVRNTLKYVPHKDMKEFAGDLKKIYLAADESE